MNNPLLVVVTGSPATGKTTLAHILSHTINCPLLSRDEFKEGLINTLDRSHSQVDRSVDLEVYETFFETIELLLSKKISLVVEAAFQDKLWRPKLLSLLEIATIKIIICKTGNDLIKARFANRLSNDPGRERFHGDQSLNAEQIAALIDHYKPVNLEVPTLEVDTTQDYDPDLSAIINFIRK